MRLIHDDAVYSHLDNPKSRPALQVVMTRFDMTIQSAPVQDEAVSKAYLRSRIPIFRAICLASMRAQTTRPDKWIIGFGPRRRAEIEPLLEELASEDWILPVWQQERDDVAKPGDQTFLRAIRSLIRPEHRYVLSTRLDNDDAISRGFCEAVLTYAAAAIAKAPEVEDFWISFQFGIQFDGKRCRLFTRNNNAFLSRCELAEGFAAGTAGAANQGNHLRVFERGRVHLPVTHSPMWLQTIHGSNVRNAPKKNLPAFRDGKAMLRGFGVKPEDLETAGISSRPPRA